MARDKFLNYTDFPSLAIVLVFGLHRLIAVTLSKQVVLRELTMRRLQKGIQTSIGITYLAKTCWTSNLTGEAFSWIMEEGLSTLPKSWLEQLMSDFIEHERLLAKPHDRSRGPG